MIGTDGKPSFIAKAVRAPMLQGKPATTAVFYSCWQDVDLCGRGEM